MDDEDAETLEIDFSAYEVLAAIQALSFLEYYSMIQGTPNHITVSSSMLREKFLEAMADDSFMEMADSERREIMDRFEETKNPSQRSGFN